MRSRFPAGGWRDYAGRLSFEEVPELVALVDGQMRVGVLAKTSTPAALSREELPDARASW